MSEHRYTIKNCPALRGWVCNKLFIEQDIMIDCEDCTDCVMKQIVELCREENIEGKSLASIMRLSNKDTKEFLSRFASNKILELLDIEEVE